MAKSKSKGESKQGLVITLVFFILATIGLGVATYYGFADQEVKDQAVKKAKGEVKIAEEQRDWHKFQAMYALSCMGKLPAANLEELGLLRGKYDSGTIKGKDKPDFDKSVKELDTDVQWNAATKRPTQTYPDLLKRAQQEVAAAKLSIQDMQKKKDAADKRELAAKKELTDAKTAYEGELVKVKEKAESGRKEDRTDLEKLRQDVKKETDKYTVKLKELDDAKRKVELALKKSEEKVRQLQKTVKEKTDAVAELTRSPAEVPINFKTSWRIVSINDRGERPYINLGSADHVKPQLTFSIHAVGADGRVNPATKGTLEVVKVIGEHLSVARITSVKDANRDPILKGDALFNPSWNPYLQKHVALAGIIDLAGDGTDNTQEFIRNLRKQNILVDAWTDTKDKDLPLKGKGITVRTDFLIIGSSRGSLTEARDAAFGKKLDDAIKSARDKARENGVTVIGLQKYLEMIGYQSPRGVADRPATGARRGGY